MSKSNYEIMRDKMQLKFLEYNQQHMIQSFHMKYDEQYLYIKFVGRDHRINRLNGRVEWSVDEFLHCAAADYNASMSIFDVLCCSKDGCCLSGHFCGVNQLKGIVHSANPGSSMFWRFMQYFDGKTELLCRACEQLGGRKENIGDVSYCLFPFEFLPMMLQFWNSDDEFPANLKIMWDENILDYVHYETTYFMLSHILERLQEFSKVRP